MPRGPAPAWRTARKEPFLDDHIRASVVQGSKDGHAHGPENGRYADLIVTGIESKERAQEIKRGLFRAAKRNGVSLVMAKVETGPFGIRVRFAAGCKECGRMYVIKKYGPDREAWPYNPRRKGVVT